MDEAERKMKFLEAMSRGSTFVTVITTDGDAGRHGVTVSSMTSVAADGFAPTILACIHHLSPAATAILANKRFCANILHEGQQNISDIFSGRHKSGHAQRFDQIKWSPGDDGQPVIAGATANFECILRTSLLWETHHVMIAHVMAVRLNEDPKALLYGQRAYRRAIEIG
ncbi:MAG: flavin reductase family protein [Rhodospirillales bacterium]|nr:flavin reductase family protein [Rhodospirillales bacterium]